MSPIVARSPLRSWTQRYADRLQGDSKVVIINTFWPQSRRPSGPNERTAPDIRESNRLIKGCGDKVTAHDARLGGMMMMLRTPE
jgi:hypothetical protein